MWSRITPKGNSISFSVFLLHFYLNYVSKVRQSDFEIEAILRFLILLLHFYPERTLAEQLCISESQPPCPHFLLQRIWSSYRTWNWKYISSNGNLSDSESRILRELKWITQFHLWSKGLRVDEKKNRSSLFLISKETLMESESGGLKGWHNFKLQHYPFDINNLNLTTSLETEQSADY